MGFIVVVLIFFILCIMGYLIRRDTLEQNKRVIGQAIDEATVPDSDFKETQSFISADLITKIAIDEVIKKIAFWIVYKETPSIVKAKVNVYSFSDVLAVEILENGVTTNQTSRKSQIGGALIGGAIAGGAGAIIGGLSGTTTSTSEIESIDLKIIINDMSNPVYIINMISKLQDNENLTIIKGTPKFNDLMKKVYHWHSILGYTIRENDEKDEPVETQKAIQVNSYSLSTQLKELNELKTQGILTDEEFQQQKGKLLNA